MRTLLPEPRFFHQFCRHENGWSDHYGALHVAAAYSGLVLPSRYHIKGVWQHGVFGPWQHFSPGILVYNAPGATEVPVFVARQDEAEVMRRHGYKQVRPIGMPILYVPEPAVERTPESLLVVPTHSLTGDNHADRTPFERYAESIKAVADRFKKVTVCIHPNCQRNGLWVKEFTEPNIEIVYGAETRDAHALLRMRTLFAQFESVTTNEWGSHVAYALAFGARVSIAGQPIAGDAALYARDEMWKNDPVAMVTAFSPEVAQQRREFLKRLYVSPLDGVADAAFGRWFIGADLKLSPAEMRETLAQLMDPPPAPPVDPAVALHARQQIEEARRTRHEIRAGARELLRTGQRAAAVKTLIRAVQADIASKNTVNVFEGLVEIAGDLAAVEPARSAILLGEADRIARGQGLTVETMRSRLAAAL